MNFLLPIALLLIQAKAAPIPAGITNPFPSSKPPPKKNSLPSRPPPKKNDLSKTAINDLKKCLGKACAQAAGAGAGGSPGKKTRDAVVNGGSKAALCVMDYCKAKK
jgi:hypothetical protein